MVTPRARIAIALAACALSACIEPNYRCREDADCDVGVLGRCELDQRCTAIDPLCPTNRRYAEHSGEASGLCFDDRVAPANLCAAGQPPAVAEGCAANVCDALPSCCSTGWSEACVLQAQMLCAGVVCDTRIAITANKTGRTELWDLAWNGKQWTARQDPRALVLAWLAPPPGQAEPQLAGFAGGAMTFGDSAIQVATNHNYLDVTSVDFDRDGRPTAALSFNDGRGQHLEITKLDDGSTREVASSAGTRLSWGDVDHDAFPDGIAEAGASNRYHLLSNTEADDHLRAIDDRVNTNVTGGTAGTPPVRSFDWVDIDDDGRLDVVVWGYSIDIHVGKGDAIGTGLLARIDCDPPSNASGCDAMVVTDHSFAGQSVPAAGGTTLVIATQPQRALYRATLRGTPPSTALSPYVFPAAPCATAGTCPPILAVVVRDLDGDHQLDVIAIDADLQVFTGLAKDNLMLRAAIKIPTAPAAAFVAVRTSVTGAPR
ncbi:MAG TPA: hypothetical protein VGD80_31765 [Kofleriaceae bacterium]